MLRRTAASGGALVALVHVWTLRSQVLDGSLAEPALLGRWLAGALLACGLVALYRRGAAVHHRHTVALLLLVVALHAPAVADRLGVPPDLGLPPAAMMLELAASAALSLAALSAALRRSGWTELSMSMARCARPTTPARSRAGYAFAITARPPPHA